MKIEDFDTKDRTFIIAEIGNNHGGDFDLAKDMIAMAAEARADAVKFQTIVPEKLVTSIQEDRLKQLAEFRFGYEQFEELAGIARRQGIIFITTPFDLETVQKIDPFVPAYKISSGDNTFWPLLECIAEKGKPVLMSTGLIDMDDLKKAVSIFNNTFSPAPLEEYLAILHCVSSYPAGINDLNLLSIKYLKDFFELPVGYSDHSEGTLSCITAVALGAEVIEKHFTYRKEGQVFKDHLLSADPSEFRDMVDRIRGVEAMLGEYKKEPLPAEQPLIIAARRSIAAARDMKAGTEISIDDLTWLRPGDGLKPGEEQSVIDRKLTRDIKKGEIIYREDIS